MMTPANPRCELCGETITPKQAVEGHVCQRTSNPLVDDLRSWIPGSITAGRDDGSRFWRGKRRMSDACLEAADEIERLTRERDEANRKHAMVTAALKEEAADNDQLRAALEKIKKHWEGIEAAPVSVYKELEDIAGDALNETVPPDETSESLNCPICHQWGHHFDWCPKRGDAK